jgi:hypothetical protein
VNAGTGKELTIKQLTELVAKVVGYTGAIKWDTSRPNGTPRKLLDVSKATALGWTYQDRAGRRHPPRLRRLPYQPHCAPNADSYTRPLQRKLL